MRRHRFAGRRKRARIQVRQVGHFALTDEPHGLQGGATGSDRRDRIGQLALDDQQPRAAIAEDVFELGAARSGVDGNGDRPEPSTAEDAEEEFQAVATHDGNAVAGLGPCLCESAGVAGRRSPNVGVR